MIESAVETYSEKVVEKPVTFLVISLIVVGGLTAGSQKVETVEENVNDFLPDSYESIQAFDTIDAEFNSAEATTYTILLETEPRYGNSDEIRDVRDPELLRYISRIESEAEQMQKVSSVGSPLDLFTNIPPERKGVKNALETAGEERWSQYISDDFSASRIRVEAAKISADEEVKLAEDLRYNIESVPKPAGVELTYTGQTYIDQAFQDESDETLNTTTTVAFLLVLVIVVLLFRSVFYGFISLEALLFGIMAGFGAFGWLGYNLSPATSGAISIGIGIAVDFGIQPVSRYREERKQEKNGMESALSTTIRGIYRPMTLGLIAALMGFSTLSLGDITFLSSLGTVLSLTTFMAYMAAFTLIPSTLIVHDKYLSDRLPELSRYYPKVKSK